MLVLNSIHVSSNKLSEYPLIWEYVRNNEGVYSCGVENEYHITIAGRAIDGNITLWYSTVSGKLEVRMLEYYTRKFKKINADVAFDIVLNNQEPPTLKIILSKEV